MLTHVQKVRMLYKAILRLHRGLPPELQVMGNTYVYDEFRRHKKCTQDETSIFMNEWSSYALNIAEQLGLKGPKTAREKYGAHLSPELLEEFRNEQIHQLHELMIAAKHKNPRHGDSTNL